MSRHSDPSVRIGANIVGRCVTMNSIHTGKVAEIIEAPGEYTTRFRLENVPDSGRSAGPIVFFQGYAGRVEVGERHDQQSTIEY